MKFATIVLLAAAIYLLFVWDRKAPATENGWKVYGTMKCGWTVKQLDYLNKKGISHTFVDCDREACQGIDGFPFLEHEDGRSHKGFTQI